MADNCWEALSCGKEESCNAFPDHGQECWLVAGTQCGLNNTGIFSKEIGNCTACPWYKALNGEAPSISPGRCFKNRSSNHEAKNCWEYFKCGMDKDGRCLAYPNFGTNCWSLSLIDSDTATMCRDAIEIKSTKLFQPNLDCKKCPWYIQMNDGNEINNCWEFWGCKIDTLNSCVAYPDCGTSCWTVAGSHVGERSFNSIASGKFAKLYRSHTAGCGDCPWMQCVSETSQAHSESKTSLEQ